MKKIKDNLIFKICLAIVTGIIFGQLTFIPDTLYITITTFTSIFKEFLNFVIPLMILAFVTKGIAEINNNAGKLLFITTGLSYFSSIIAGLFAYGVNSIILPSFINKDIVNSLTSHANELQPAFEFKLTPVMDVTSAIVFAFIIGIGISHLRQHQQGKELFQIFCDFEMIIQKLLSGLMIPMLPFYIFGNFVQLSYSGTVFYILSVFWKVFILVILLHIIYLSLLFLIASIYGRKNFMTLVRHQMPAYVTALGTQSSAATIPVNLEAAKNNGVLEDVRNCVIPLCATIHLAGSMITIVSCSLASILIYNIPYDFNLILTFIIVLGLVMVAAPGTPGGAIMSALPFLPMIHINSEIIQQLMISLYITQDSFGTAANISGDNALAIIINRFIHKDNRY